MSDVAVTPGDAPTDPTAGDAGPPAGPPTGRPIRTSPLATWGRRGVILVLLVGAVAVLAWGGRRAETAQPTSTGDLVVVAQFPLADGSALRQTEVGADLVDGFDGRLVINGIAIPEEEMDGVLAPGSPEAAGYTGSELRPNNRNHVFFSPAPGKVIEKLPQGEITVTVNYFRDGQPTAGRGSATWTFRVD